MNWAFLAANGFPSGICGAEAPDFRLLFRQICREMQFVPVVASCKAENWREATMKYGKIVAKAAVPMEGKAFRKGDWVPIFMRSGGWVPPVP